MQNNSEARFEHGELFLMAKPTAALAYSYIAGGPETDTLIVFINGLMLPRSGWQPAMSLLIRQFEDMHKKRPAMLAYDRFGQGDSDPDPADGNNARHTHDLNDVVFDLHRFLEEFVERKLGKHHRRLVFVCNSIGCPIARLFAQAHPATVSAFIFLDSMMANTDFVSIFPDPDASDFDRNALPEGVTEDGLREARTVYRRFFHPTVPNKERLDRSNAAQLLPYSDAPAIAGSNGRGPLVTVVGHDWDVFAAENTKSFGINEALCNTYINPYWHRYNEGLCKLTAEQWSEGPIIANGCGHFIQRDRPEFVAGEVVKMLERLQTLETSLGQ